MDRNLTLWRRVIMAVATDTRAVGAAVGAFAYQLVRGEHPPQTVHHESEEQRDGARSVRLSS